MVSIPVSGPVDSQTPTAMPLLSAWKYVPSAWKMASVGGLLGSSRLVSSHHVPTTALSAVAIGAGLCARAADASPATARRLTARIALVNRERRTLHAGTSCRWRRRGHSPLTRRGPGEVWAARPHLPDVAAAYAADASAPRRPGHCRVPGRRTRRAGHWWDCGLGVSTGLCGRTAPALVSRWWITLAYARDG